MNDVVVLHVVNYRGKQVHCHRPPVKTQGPFVFFSLTAPFVFVDVIDTGTYGDNNIVVLNEESSGYIDPNLPETDEVKIYNLSAVDQDVLFCT